MKKFLVLTALAAALSAAPAAAKEGLYAGGYVSIANIKGSSPDSFDQAYFDNLDTGLGAGLRVGAGFNEYVALEGTLFKSSHETDFLGFSILESQEFTGKTLALKVNFPDAGNDLEPYIFAGLGVYEIGDSGGTYYKGKGKELGFGFDLYLAPEVSINAGLTFTRITFDKGKFYLDQDIDANVVTLDIGASFHFL